MKVYLAAPYAEMKRMLEWEKVLHDHGHECTAQWVHGAEANGDKTRAQCAQMDLDDIDRADAVVSMTLALGTMFSSGGRHVEFGYAVAQRKRLVNVNAESHYENVFHYLPQVIVLPTIHAAATYLLGVEAKGLL